MEDEGGYIEVIFGDDTPHIGIQDQGISDVLFTGVTPHYTCAGLVWFNPNASHSNVRGIVESQLGGIPLHDLCQVCGLLLRLLHKCLTVQ